MKETRHGDFVLGVPEGWVDTTLVTLRSPKEGRVQSTLTVARCPLAAPASAMEFAAAQWPELQRSFGPDCVRLLEEGPVTLAAESAFRRVYECAMNEGRVLLTQAQYYVVRSQTAYIVTLTDTRDHFQSAFQHAEQAIRAFRFAEP